MTNHSLLLLSKLMKFDFHIPKIGSIRVYGRHTLIEESYKNPDYHAPIYDTLNKALITQKHLQIVGIQKDLKKSALLLMHRHFILLTVDFNFCYLGVLMINYD